MSSIYKISCLDCLLDEFIFLDQPDWQHFDHVDAVLDVLSQRGDVEGVQENGEEKSDNHVSNYS